MNTRKNRVTKPYKKVLKSCTRCRQHKTKCDADVRKPLACTHCSRKSFECVFDVIDTPPKRSSEVVEQLTAEVGELKEKLYDMIESRSKMIQMLLGDQRPSPMEDLQAEDQASEGEFEYESQSESNYDSEESESELEESEFESDVESEGGTVETEHGDHMMETDSKPSPLHSDISVSSLSYISSSSCKIIATTTIQIPSATTAKLHSTCTDTSFKLESTQLSVQDAEKLFEIYRTKFHKFFPVLPNQFLFDLKQVYNESDLLFWSIVVVSMTESQEIEGPSDSLITAVKALVVDKCWYNTPRSVHTLLALSILTTWPIHNDDALSTNYLSLMNNLSLQLGLHKSEFIQEFSHKTQVGISKYSSDNNKLIRERLYKYISSQSYYWLTFLGYPQQTEEDFILDRAHYQVTNNRNDQYINSLLKLSSIQSKISKIFESSDHSVTRLYQINKTKRFINIGMFEQILNEFSLHFDSNSADYNLLELSIQYTKLQLYLFSFSPLDKFKTDLNLSVDEYKQYVYKALQCCYKIVVIFNKTFAGRKSVDSIPIQYRFALELSLLTMMKIYYSPLLGKVEDFKQLKAVFQSGYKWYENRNFEGEKVVSILKGYEEAYKLDKSCILGIDTKSRKNHNKIINNDHNKFFLLKTFKDYFVSTLSHEMSKTIERVKKEEAKGKHSECISWERLGLNTGNDQKRQIIEYLENENCGLIN
ncbi:hypothetical protein CLIB1423_03S02322 [[Candida] railenensis]|uniref:Zn(2)-C6 fungal-type domain-containing protein n=1 Tax=[Candida] railenensis TaxID=45579 RepID=A0A9P0QMG3_9ASCO|nr:hypothetical protein CLIB1423_03S02322 [[Candida] railenensis]